MKNPVLSENMQKKAVGYLGLAQKAGKIAAGDLAVMNALKNGSAKIIIIATDTAPSVMAEVEKRLVKKQVPVYLWGEKIFLGSIIGKSRRGALAVLDQGFADAIEKVFLG